MSDRAVIRLNRVNISDQSDIDILIQAANEVYSANEADFHHMKNKKWYKRFWEIITFSRDNQKVMARHVASLAKTQDIVKTAILMVSKESREIAEQLRVVAELQPQLEKAINRIIYKHEPRPDIRNMSEQHQFVIFSTLFKFVNMSYPDGDVPSLVHEYLLGLRGCCESSLYPQVDFDCGKIEQLDFDGHKLLAITMCEIAVLMDNAQREVAFNEIREYVNISPHSFKDIKQNVEKTSTIMGKESISNYYTDLTASDDISLIDADGIEFEEVHETSKLKDNVPVKIFFDCQHAKDAAKWLCDYINENTEVPAIFVERKVKGKIHSADLISKNIIFGHHSDTDRRLDALNSMSRLKYSKYGMRYNFDEKICVLTASKSELRNSKRIKKEFKDDYIKTFDTPPTEHDRAKQFNFLANVFALSGLGEFLGIEIEDITAQY